MQPKGFKIFTAVFSLILIGELITGQYNDYSYLHCYFKPAIVLSLMVYFWRHSATLDGKFRVLIMLALLLSVFGDTLLMFVNKFSNFFLYGLISFLIAHVFYVLAFNSQRNKKINPVGFILLLLIYTSGLFNVLKEGLETMLIPVILYMLVILSMAIMAYLRKGIVNRASYTMVLIGAILFLVSDSILALDKFYEPQIYANITIMLTYAFAQFFIVIGILKHQSL